MCVFGECVCVCVCVCACARMCVVNTLNTYPLWQDTNSLLLTDKVCFNISSFSLELTRQQDCAMWVVAILISTYSDHMSVSFWLIAEYAGNIGDAKDPAAREAEQSRILQLVDKF